MLTHNQRFLFANRLCLRQFINTLSLEYLTTATHLEDILYIKLLKNTTLKFNKLVRDHYSKKSFTVTVNGNVDGNSLAENQDSMNN